MDAKFIYVLMLSIIFWDLVYFLCDLCLNKKILLQLLYIGRIMLGALQIICYNGGFNFVLHVLMLQPLSNLKPRLRASHLVKEVHDNGSFMQALFKLCMHLEGNDVNLCMHVGFHLTHT